MPFVEVYSQAGSVSSDQKSRIAERLVAEVMRAEGAPDNEQVRSISWLVWHEPKLWSIGGRPVGAGDPPRYVVRVTVPAPALDDAKRAEIVKRVTQVLAEAEDDPDRLLTSLDSFVLLNEVPDGDWGSLGQVFRVRRHRQLRRDGRSGTAERRRSTRRPEDRSDRVGRTRRAGHVGVQTERSGLPRRGRLRGGDSASPSADGNPPRGGRSTGMVARPLAGPNVPPAVDRDPRVRCRSGLQVDRQEETPVRKIIIAALAAGALIAGPFASSASADHDPVREAFCRAAEKLGVVWVQDCNLH